MLKLVYAMADLDAEQLLKVYHGQGINEIDFLNYLRECFFQQRNAFYALWAVQGSYKAALRIEPNEEDGLILTGLSTAPEARRRGYAYELVKHVLEHLRTTPHNMLYSHIEKKNIPSMELHKKCGFQLHSDSARYIDGTVTQNSCTMCCHL